MRSSEFNEPRRLSPIACERLPFQAPRSAPRGVQPGAIGAILPKTLSDAEGYNEFLHLQSLKQMEITLRLPSHDKPLRQRLGTRASWPRTEAEASADERQLRPFWAPYVDKPFPPNSLHVQVEELLACHHDAPERTLIPGHTGRTLIRPRTRRKREGRPNTSLTPSSDHGHGCAPMGPGGMLPLLGVVSGSMQSMGSPPLHPLHPLHPLQLPRAALIPLPAVRAHTHAWGSKHSLSEPQPTQELRGESDYTPSRRTQAQSQSQWQGQGQGSLSDRSNRRGRSGKSDRSGRSGRRDRSASSSSASSASGVSLLGLCSSDSRDSLCSRDSLFSDSDDESVHHTRAAGMASTDPQLTRKMLRKGSQPKQLVTLRQLLDGL
jgi:hypothetical protein